MIDIIIRVGTAGFPNFQIVMSESSESDPKESLKVEKKNRKIPNLGYWKSLEMSICYSLVFSTLTTSLS